MYKATQLQSLIFGATSNIFITLPETTTPKQVPKTRVLNLLIELAKNDYDLKDKESLFDIDVDTMSAIEEQIFPVLNSQTLTAYKLRDSFGKSVDLERYTDEEWKVIAAQYKLTYGV